MLTTYQSIPRSTVGVAGFANRSRVLKIHAQHSNEPQGVPPARPDACQLDLSKLSLGSPTSRRDVMKVVSIAASTLGLLGRVPAGWAQDSSMTPMEALKGKDYGKSRLRYKDYVMTESGLQYTDLKEGTGEMPKPGDTVVIDWDGYTIGYYGRPFEARNKPKGSSFTGRGQGLFQIPGRGEDGHTRLRGGHRRHAGRGHPPHHRA
eukprot:jgi/Botrbrau1/1698/Bobra.116_2s0040.1